MAGPFSPLKIVTLVALATSVAVATTGCGSVVYAILVSLPQQPSIYDVTPPRNDSPKQLIYQVDDLRYMTLENYEDCRVSGVITWHDTARGTHTVIYDWGSGVWVGRFMMDPGSEHLAFPTYECTHKSCELRINTSNDGGKKWSYFAARQYSSKANEETNIDYTAVRNTTVRVSADGYVYISVKGESEYRRYNIELGSFSQEKEERCTPEGYPETWGSDEYYFQVTECMNSRRRTPPFPPVPEGRYDRYDLASIPDVHTPSGQDRFTCDPSLNPAIKKKKTDIRG